MVVDIGVMVVVVGVMGTVTDGVIAVATLVVEVEAA